MTGIPPIFLVGIGFVLVLLIFLSSRRSKSDNEKKNSKPSEPVKVEEKKVEQPASSLQKQIPVPVESSATASKKKPKKKKLTDLEKFERTLQEALNDSSNGSKKKKKSKAKKAAKKAAANSDIFAALATYSSSEDEDSDDDFILPSPPVVKPSRSSAARSSRATKASPMTSVPELSISFEPSSPSVEGWETVEKRLKPKKVVTIEEDIIINDLNSDSPIVSEEIYVVSSDVPTDITQELVAEAFAAMEMDMTGFQEVSDNYRAPGSPSSDSDSSVAIPEVPVVETISREVIVDAKKVGVLIGSRGANRTAIEDASGAKLTIPKTDKGSSSAVSVTVVGPKEAVDKAVAIIEDLVVKGYSSVLEGDDFRESTLAFYPSYLPIIIGAKGANIRALQDRFQVRVTVPPVEPESKSKVKITLAGKKDNVAQAKAMLKDIKQYYHSEVTHPGVVHLELSIDPRYFSHIIGNHGQMIRHLQRSNRVNIYIPGEGWENSHVVLVGLPSQVDAARSGIEKLIEAVESGGRRGEEEDGEDPFAIPSHQKLKPRKNRGAAVSSGLEATLPSGDAGSNAAATATTTTAATATGLPADLPAPPGLVQHPEVVLENAGNTTAVFIIDSTDPLSAF